MQDVRCEYARIHAHAEQGDVRGVCEEMNADRTAINAVTRKERMRPIHYAARNGFPEIVDCLAQNGAWLHTTNSGGSTPLHLASDNGHAECVRALFAYGGEGLDPNAKNTMRRTPLHLASIKGHDEIVKILLRNGATRHLRDRNNKLALDYARELGKESTALLLQM